MLLTHFACRNFRCLTQTTFNPAPGMNILHGGNAQGKTSILEAILYGTTSRSHRTTTEADLCQHEQPGFRVELQASTLAQPVHIEANWWRQQKRVKINGVAQTRISDILGRIRVVFFAPEDVALIKGSGGNRRRFMDMELAQLSPPYLQALQHYKKILRQRNETLRAKRPDPVLLDVFDEQLAHHGTLLILERAAFIDQLAEFAQEAYAAVAGGETFRLRYQPCLTPGEDLEAALKLHRERDIRRAQSLFGPHRDDLEFYVGDQPARSYGSQGQQKTAALALKLAEVKLIHHRHNDYPVLLLDEALAELDPQRANRLFDMLDGQVQCLITTTDLPPALAAQHRELTCFRIERGEIEKE